MQKKANLKWDYGGSALVSWEHLSLLEDRGVNRRSEQGNFRKNFRANLGGGGVKPLHGVLHGRSWNPTAFPVFSPPGICNLSNAPEKPETRGLKRQHAERQISQRKVGEAERPKKTEEGKFTSNQGG